MTDLRKSPVNLLIFGLADNARTTARAFRKRGWRVRFAVHHPSQGQADPRRTDSLVCYLPDLEEASLKQAGMDQVDALVALSNSDDNNFEVCRCAKDCLNVGKVLVRANDLANMHRFYDLGATVIAPKVGVMDLLRHLSRSTSYDTGFLESSHLVGG